jgi:phage gpG-like protein
VIRITLNETASALLARATAEMLPSVMRGLRATFDRENELTGAHIKQNRATGLGPFPVAEHRLGVKTGRYRRSIRRSKAVVTGNILVASIGSNVEYAGVHEFGAVIQRTVKAGTVRLRLDKFGQLLRQTDAYNDNRAVFARKSHKNVYTKEFAGGKQYTVTIPARAPITTGIEDRAAALSAAASKSVIDTLNGLGLQ